RLPGGVAEGVPVGQRPGILGLRNHDRLVESRRQLVDIRPQAGQRALEDGVVGERDDVKWDALLLQVGVESLRLGVVPAEVGVDGDQQLVTWLVACPRAGDAGLEQLGEIAPAGGRGVAGPREAADPWSGAAER